MGILADNRLLFHFNSAHGVDYKIRVRDIYEDVPWDDDYTTVQRPLGRAPSLIRKKDGPILSTSLEFYAECQTEGDYAELYTTSATRYEVNLYRDDVLIWTGFLCPELYSEPLIAPPYDIKLIASDNLSELKMKVQTESSYLYGKLAGNLIALLQATGRNGYPIYVASSLCKHGNTAVNFPGSLVNLQYMMDESYYDILTSILKSMNAILMSYKDGWLILRETDLPSLISGSSLSVTKITSASSYSSDTIAGYKKSAGKMGVADMWPVGYMTRSVQSAKKSVTIKMPWRGGNLFGYSGKMYGWQYTSDSEFDNGTIHIGNNTLTTDTIALIRHNDTVYGWPPYTTIRLKVTGKSRNAIVLQDYRFAIGFYVALTIGDGTQGPPYTIYYYNGEWRTTAPSSSSDVGMQQIPYCEGEDTLDKAEDIEWSVPPVPSIMTDPQLPVQMSVGLYGRNAHVYTAEMEIDAPNKGYVDKILINNGAREAAGEEEIFGGRLDSEDILSPAMFLGVWNNSQKAIIRFSDANYTNKDYLSIISLSYAKSNAAPRLRMEGRLDFPTNLPYIPIILTNGGVSYILETFDWNLKDEEFQFSAISVPTATLSVTSETITEIE